MSYEPITYCRQCYEPFDVYHAPDERLCEGCVETLERAELGVDGNAGFALLGQDIQVGEAEFEEFIGDVRTSEGARQAKLAINRAFTRLKKRIGKPISYFLGTSHPDHC